MSDSAVILLSGGLDSAANLAIALEQSLEVKLALTADYGQRAASSEIRAARSLCDYYGVPHQGVALPWLGALGGSSLTDSNQAVPLPQVHELDDVDASTRSARSVWVPNRNGVLIHVAAAYAERLGATQVLVGFNAEEAVTFPDNSREFLEHVNESLRESTANHVRVSCFTLAMNKKQIVAFLRDLRRPFPRERVWSCYFSGEQACGRCESCRRFNRAWGDQ